MFSGTLALDAALVEACLAVYAVKSFIPAEVKVALTCLEMVAELARDVGNLIVENT